MLRSIVCLTVLWSAALHAQTHTEKEATLPWDIASVELRQINEPQDPMVLNGSDCSAQPLDDLTDVSLGDIITAGQEIWKIVEAGKPVVNLQTPRTSALPRALSCWTDLDGWQVPVVTTYEVSYKNLMSIEVIHFRFRLQYTAGGGKNGVGKYLANVTVLPAELNVSWGYDFAAGVQVEPAINVGTSQNPVAGLELSLVWTVKTVVKQSDNSFHFFVRGDGSVQTAN